MPKGLQGQKRPVDAIGMSVMVAQIATCEIEDNEKFGRTRSGKIGGEVCAKSLSKEERSEIAKLADQVRWK